MPCQVLNLTRYFAANPAGALRHPEGTRKRLSLDDSMPADDQTHRPFMVISVVRTVIRIVLNRN